MPSETTFSFVRSIAEPGVARRAEPSRAAPRDERTHPETFGALVSEAAHARKPEKPDPRSSEAAPEPVDPRPAQPGREARRADEKAAKDERPARPAESREDKGGCCEARPDDRADLRETRDAEAEARNAVEGEAVAKTETAAETKGGDLATGETGTTETVSEGTQAPVIETMAPVISLVVTPPAAETETPVPGAGDELSVGSKPATLSPAELAKANAEAVKAGVEGKAIDPATAEAVATTSTESTDPAKTTATGEDNAEVPKIARESGFARELATTKPGARTADAGDETMPADAAKGKDGAAEGTPKKPVAPDLAPTRLSRVADLVEALGVSNAIHRPADILAGLDRAVQAGATSNAAARAAEVSRPTPLQMLPIEVGMQAVRGVTNFQIRLDPAELGRVDVRLQIRDNGEVNASLVVDRVETLAMLKRDASTLQQAFEQAGLRQSADGLSFSLRGEGQNGQQNREGQGGARAGLAGDDPEVPPQVADIAMRRAYVNNSNLDLMI